MDYTYIEKPEWISYEDIHELLWAANETNRKAGFVLSTSKLSADGIKARIGEDGKCFVALDDQKLVGTISVRFLERNAWFATGKVADYMLAAVLPEYQGKHINTALSELVFEFAREAGCSVVELDTAENNRHAISVYEHLGFEKVSFKANPGGDHYSVIMAKWFEERPFSKKHIAFRYKLKRMMIRIRYKENRKKRFGI